MTFDQAEKFLEQYFGVVLASAVVLLVALLFFINEIIKRANEVLENLFKVASTLKMGDRRASSKRRMRFAHALIDKIKLWNDAERWGHEDYAETEAEVEVEGPRRGLFSTFEALIGGDLRHRESSLTKAIMRSKDRLIQLSGDPGAGKSVALRYVAMVMAKKASRSLWSRQQIGLYITLKNFRPDGVRDPSAELRQYILEIYRQIGAGYQGNFVEESFEANVEHGAWIFLFDSFDEIPEILSAVDGGAVVEKYESIIQNFMQTVHPCRGVVASREFRGPRDLHWTKFVILPLSNKRQRAFINHINIDNASKAIISDGLATAPSGIKVLSENSMFLGLLCQYVFSAHRFPNNTHEVFENYIERCLESNRGQYYGLTSPRVRAVAEEMAYCMAIDPRLGLSVDMSVLANAMKGLRLEGAELLTQVVQSLRRARIARWEYSAENLDGPPFSFAHRRFQEYFATCYVLRRPGLIRPATLLSSGRWRETAVTLLQSQERGDTRLLLLEASKRLGAYLRSSQGNSVEQNGWVAPGNPQTSQSPGRFVWTDGMYHLLDLLNSGWTVQDLGTTSPEWRAVSRRVGLILRRANSKGGIVDRKWALDVSGPAPTSTLLPVLQAVFKTRSAWLRQSAFRLVGRLRPLPESMRREVLLALLSFSISGDLRQNSTAMTAQLSRLDGSKEFLAAKRVLLALPVVDACAGVIAVMLSLLGYSSFGFTQSTLTQFFIVATGVLSATLLYIVRASTSFSWGPGSSSSALLSIGRSSVLSSIAYVMLVLVRSILIGGSAFGLLILLNGLLVGERLENWQIFSLLGLCLLVSILMATWAPCVLGAIRNGVIVPGVLWIAPQILFAGFAILKLFRLLRLYWIWILALGFLAGAFALIVPTRVQQSGAFVFTYVVLVISAVLLFVSLILAVRAMVRTARELIQLYRLVKRTPLAVDGQGILDLLQHYSSASGPARALRILRKAGVLRNSPGAVANLMDLLQLREILEPASRDADQSVTSTELSRENLDSLSSEEIVTWASANLASASKRLKRLDSDFWDEAARAVDDVSAARRKTTLEINVDV